MRLRALLALGLTTSWLTLAVSSGAALAEAYYPAHDLFKDSLFNEKYSHDDFQSFNMTDGNTSYRLYYYKGEILLELIESNFRAIKWRGKNVGQFLPSFALVINSGPASVDKTKLVFIRYLLEAMIGRPAASKALSYVRGHYEDAYESLDFCPSREFGVLSIRTCSVGGKTYVTGRY